MSDQTGSGASNGNVVIDGVGGREPWPAAAVFLLIGVPLMVIFVGLASWWGISHIEGQLVDEAREDFADNGLDPDLFDIDFDYRDGDAVGPLPVGVSAREAELYVDDRLLNDFDVEQDGTIGGDDDDEADEPEPVAATIDTSVVAELVDGMIVLRGTVASDSHRQALLDAAADVVGADNVVDELVVGDGDAVDGAGRRVQALARALRAAGPDDTLMFALTDTSLDVSGTMSGSNRTIANARAGALTRLVADAGLEGAADIDGVPVGSTDAGASYDGESIILTGTVLTEAHREALTDAAASVVGEGNVIDQLVVLRGEALVPGADDRVADMAAAIRAFADGDTIGATLSDNGVDTIAAPEEELADDVQIDELQVELDGLAAEIRENVVFATGSDVLDAGATATLDKVVDAMTRHPLPVVEVSGHTDSTGDPDANRTLSGARAQAVVDYLVSQGVDEARLQSRGAGADEPIADNGTADGRAQNRRVELTAAAEFVAG